MNYLNRVIFGLIVLTANFAFVSSSMAQASEDLLVKKWKISFDDMLDQMPAEQKAMFEALDTLPPEQKVFLEQQMKQARETVELTSFEFKTDGSMEVISPASPGSDSLKTETGTWSLEEDGKIIKMVHNEDGKVDTLTVYELGKEKLIIGSADRPDQRLVLIPKE